MEFQRKLLIALAVMVLIGTGVRVCLVMLPIESLIVMTLYDDAFYYYLTAQHILAGSGSTFDGVNATNGYHPLWMLINLLAFSIFESSEESVRLLLMISVLLDLATGAVVALIAYLLTRDALITPVIAALWLFNHRVIFATLNGLETALSMMAIAVAFLCFYLAVQHASYRRLILLGVASGLAFLARTDNIILVAILVTLLIIVVQRSRVLIVPSIAAAIMMPWTIWNLATFGSIIQDSAIALRGFEVARITEIDQSTIGFAGTTLVPLYLNTLKLLYVATGVPVGQYLIITGIWTVLVAAAGFPILRNWWKEADDSRRWLVIALLAWPICLIAVHVFWRWGFRPHYLSSTFISILIPYSAVLVGLVRSNSLFKRGLVLALVPLMILSHTQLPDLMPHFLQDQREMSRAAEWLNDACTDQEECPVVGSLNAGVVGFYYRGQVVNLDGSVNSAAVEAIYDRSLGAYIEDEDIVYLADFNRALDFEHPVWGWEENPPFTLVYDHQGPGPVNHRYVIYQRNE